MTAFFLKHYNTLPACSTLLSRIAEEWGSPSHKDDCLLEGSLDSDLRCEDQPRYLLTPPQYVSAFMSSSTLWGKCYLLKLFPYIVRKLYENLLPT